MTILVVDDLVENRRMLNAVLSNEGFQVCEAGDGIEALQILEREPVDIVISDILMPNMDGYRLCTEVRGSGRFNNLPFVFYTSTYTSPSDEAFALGIGADKFIRKPAPARVLVGAVRELVSSPRRVYHPVTLPAEFNLATEYTQRLVAKLEEKNGELHRRTQEWREATGHLQAVIQSAPVAIITLDPEGIVKTWNPAATRIFGWSEAEAVGQRPLYVREEDGREFDGLCKRVLKGETLVGLELRRHRRDGSVVNVELNAGPMQDADGNIVGQMAVLADITNRRIAEEALRAGEERFRRYFELGLIGMAITAPTKANLEVNDRICEILGYEREELLSITWADITHPDDLAADVADFNRVLAGEISGYTMDKRFIRKDGGIIHATISVRCVRRADGLVDYFVALLQDITENKRAADQLEKLAAALHILTSRLFEVQEEERRHLARELHDEIGQSLTAAKMEIEAAKQLNDPAAMALRLDDGLAVIEHLLQSVRALSFDLRPPLLDEVGLAAALRAHVQSNAARAGIAIRLNIEDSLERIDSATEIACFRVAQEALTNIFRHAQAKLAEIELRSRGDELHLLVRDDGIGFDAGAASIGPARGAGFGLLSMRERVQLVGGRFACKSSAGHGTEIEAKFLLRRMEAGGK